MQLQCLDPFLSWIARDERSDDIEGFDPLVQETEEIKRRQRAEPEQ